MPITSSFRYDKQWYERATQRISEAFVKVSYKIDSIQEISNLNQLFQNIETTLTLIKRCDSKVHREKILPQYIAQFEQQYGIKILF